MASKYVNDLIISSTTHKINNLLMNELPQVIGMEFNVLHITVHDMIINNL